MRLQWTSWMDWKRWLLAVLILPGAVVLAAVIVDQANLQRLRMRIDASQANARRQGYDRIARDREERLREDLVRRAGQETDRSAVNSLAYAGARLLEPRIVVPLQRWADTGPDDLQRASLIISLARATGRDLRLQPWLRDGVRSGEPWRRAGCAAGLVELGLVEGGEALVDLLVSGPGEVRYFAAQQLQRIMEPVSHAVGRSLDWPGWAEVERNPARWEEIRIFWRRWVTPMLLCDALDRIERQDERWRSIMFLEHGRQRAAEYVN